MSRFLWPWVFWLHINFIYWEIAQGNSTVIAVISEYLLSIHVSYITTEFIYSHDDYDIFKVRLDTPFYFVTGR